MVTLPVTLGDN